MYSGNREYEVDRIQLTPYETRDEKFEKKKTNKKCYETNKNADISLFIMHSHCAALTAVAIAECASLVACCATGADKF